MRKYVRLIAMTALVFVVVSGCGGKDNTADLEGEKVVAIETPASYKVVSDKESVIKDNADEATNSNTGVVPNGYTGEEPNSNAVSDFMNSSEDSAGNDVDSQSEKLDYIDLTEMSSTMVYSQVYNMVFYPERFIGTKVKMEGIYSDYFDMAKGNHYFGCLIMDATACCAQGIEFQPTDEYSYPDDYPSDGDMVTVEGEFDIYTEDGNQYCTLKNASIIGFTEIQQ